MKGKELRWTQETRLHKYRSATDGGGTRGEEMKRRCSPESIRAVAGSPERGAQGISGGDVLINIFSGTGP
jgi:hypothetical protein